MKTENYKKPTLKQKVELYEYYLHKINMLVTSCNNVGISELVHNADMWSYAHRKGECVSDKQRDQMIANAFWKLCDTPEADRLSKERQKAWTENQKQKEIAFTNSL
jgi:hypothetical protein